MENRGSVPKVSVIFPICNNESYLRKCVLSVMSQSLEEIELILIDDGSRDGSGRICDELAQKDARIRVMHKENEGAAKSCNRGIDMARGEYIAFVESDDSVHEQMYEKLYNYARALNADVVKCGFYYCEGDQRHEMRSFYNIARQGEVFRAVDRPAIFNQHASMWAGVYRRAFLDANHLRFVETPAASYSDFSWSAMVYGHADRIAIFHEPLYFYTYDNPNSSRVSESEKCFYKPYHCLESNRILREAGAFDSVKEYLGYQEYRTCLANARRIRKDLRHDYFARLQAVLSDISRDGYAFEVFRPHEKRMARLALKGREGLFYGLLDLETMLMRLMNGNGAARRLMWNMKLRKT